MNRIEGAPPRGIRESLQGATQKLEALAARAHRLEGSSYPEGSRALDELRGALRSLREASALLAEVDDPPPYACEYPRCSQAAAAGARFCSSHLHFHAIWLCAVRGCQEPPVLMGGKLCRAHQAASMYQGKGRPTAFNRDLVYWLSIRLLLPDPPLECFAAVDGYIEEGQARREAIRERGGVLCGHPPCYQEPIHPELSVCSSHSGISLCEVRGCEEPAPYGDMLCATHEQGYQVWVREEQPFDVPHPVAYRVRRFFDRRLSPEPTPPPEPVPIPGLGSAITTHGLPAGEAPGPVGEALLGLPRRCVSGDCSQRRVEGHALCQEHLEELTQLGGRR